MRLLPAFKKRLTNPYLHVHRVPRKQLELRLQPGGTDFLAAVAREVASEKQSYTQRESELKDKVEEGRKAYAALEDEFRMALTFEAARFSEVC